MMSDNVTRSVRAVHEAERDDIADLVTRRPLPGRHVQQISPFLFLNHHGPQLYGPHNRGLPFGPHPHRGFETITFIMKGSLAHQDSAGHASVINAGGVQWMTAGSGLVHAEVSPPAFRDEGGPLEILQLWVNLPSSLKMTEPGYTGLQEVDIPAIPFAGAKASIRLVSGEFSGTQGPITSLTDVFMSVVRLDAGASDLLPAPRHRNVFFYIVEGSGSVSNVSYRKWQLIEFTSDADMIEIRAEQPTVLVFGHADPILEPVVAHGPFVMNRPEEIVEAYRDYEAGKFDRVTPLRQVGH